MTRRHRKQAAYRQAKTSARLEYLREQCYNKMTYATEEEAVASIIIMYNKNTAPYQCRVCKKYHIGSRWSQE